MASLELNDVRKSYGETLVLDGVSLSVEPREFIAFLGPSGSGKSTLLRIIAGLETLDSGEVWLDGRRIDGLKPGERDVAMVFQHYALYPHMTVRENMAFGLKNARVPQAEIDERIAQAAASLEIESQLDKKPGQMSGGQRQRVAIGRAIVKAPKLFLLDEPLSNLDAALRNRTRVELAQLRQRVEAALIMVTHDQAEAMTLADRIIVMNDRVIQQVGAPMELYTRPANAWVARFVGSPAMTLAPGVIVPGDSRYARVRLASGAEVETRVLRDGLADDSPVELGLRSEYVVVTAPGAGTLDADASLVERLGDRTLVYARLSDGLEVTAQDEGNSQVKIGDRIGLRVDGGAAHLFGPDGVGHHAEAAARVSKAAARGKDWSGLLFVLPFLLVYLVILIYPLLTGIALSMQRVDLFGGGTFVGLDNYGRLFADASFRQAVWNTFALALIIVPLLTVIALALALALNRATRGAAVFRGIFFSSSVLSVTIVTLIWRFVLAPDAGLMGEAAKAMGTDPIPFLSHPTWSLWALAITTIWWSIGLPMMLFLAGLQQIPGDIYEAAALDRASKWTTFWRVTLPSLKRTVVLVIMLQTAAQLQIFGQAQLLTGGGPGGATRTMVLFIFEGAFGRWELGYATAAAEILFLLIVLLTLTQYFTTMRGSEDERGR